MAKIGENEARFIIDNHKTMKRVDMAGKLGISTRSLHDFLTEFVDEQTPDESMELFIHCRKKSKGVAWAADETQTLIDNFCAEPRVLQKLIGRKLRSIRDKQRELVSKAKRDQLPPKQVKKILALNNKNKQMLAKNKLTKKKQKEEKRREEEAARVEDQVKKAIARGVLGEEATVEHSLPELEIGAKYKIRSDLPWRGIGRFDRRGRVICYYPGGKFYIVDFGKYKETISQIDLLTGQVEAS